MQFGNIYRCDRPTIVFLDNHAIVELDFTVHTFNQPTALFLKKNQYFKLIDGTPELFPLNDQIDLNQYRYLFSHLTGIGHIMFDRKNQFAPDLEKSLEDWRTMNPFNASENELNLLFDTNDFFEQNLDPSLPVSEVLPTYRQLNQISSKHINQSLHQWKSYKLIVQAKYLLFFAGKSIQEVAYELRFKDPAYFGRFFKRITQQTPGQFLNLHEQRPSKYVLLDQLMELIEEHFKSQHFIQFYAERLNMTAKSLGEKVKKEYNVSVKDLISNRLSKEGMTFKNLGFSVSESAHLLGFKEVSHYSAFMKKHATETSQKVPKTPQFL